MPTVEFVIRNKNYSIACDEGEESRIDELAEALNVRVDAIAKTFSSASDSLIMAITAIMMEDEIRALKAEDKTPQASIASVLSEEAQDDKLNVAIIDALEPITKYVETLANRIENS